jgi:hypothetical protein
MKKTVKRLVKGTVALYREYPARCNAVIAGAVVAGLGALGVTADIASVKEIVGLEVPILVAGEATHRRVSPNQ